MERISTPETGELSLAATVFLLGISALGARSTGVAWVYEQQRNASQQCLVRYELSQLSKAPSVVLVTLAFANRYPLADTRQVFQGQRGAGVFGMGDKLLRNAMVHVTTKTRLMPRHLFQAPLGTFGMGRLVGLPGTSTALRTTSTGVPV